MNKCSGLGACETTLTLPSLQGISKTKVKRQQRDELCLPSLRPVSRVLVIQTKMVTTAFSIDIITSE